MGLSCFKSWKHDSTGHKGNRDVLASPGSYFFLSNSAGQGDEWLKSLNKGVWIPFTGVFGQRLEETVLYERRYGLRLVPLVVEQCVNFIRECGLHEVGLFRQPGQASLVKELQEAFDAGERPSFDSSTDVHTVASLLKLYLRQLPEPLVPYRRYQDFLLCGQKLSIERTLVLVELRNLLHELPVANFNLLNFICQFLNEVQSFSSSNKMSGQNLATVFGPNILRAKAEDPQSIMGGAALVQVLMLELIREHESLFAKVPPTARALPPRGSHRSPGALRQPHLQPPLCLRQLSMPLIAERSAEAGPPSADGQNLGCVFSAAAKSDLSFGQKRFLGHRYTSSHPENCFYPVPSSSQPLQHHSDRHNVDYRQRHVGRGPSSANVDPGEADAGFWRPGGAEEEGAAPGPASGGSSEAQEDSNLSAYDNLDGESLRHRMEDAGHFESDHPRGHIGPRGEDAAVEGMGHSRDSSSSWSSCEVLPLDEGGEAMALVFPDASPKTLTTPERVAGGENAGNDHPGDCNDSDDNDEDNYGGDDAVHHLNSPASCSAASDSPLSTGSSEVFLPSGPPALRGPEPESKPGDAHSTLAELQHQMAQQKAEYQTRIQRLERCNDVLERQVAVLRVSLERQKRSRSVAQIKVRNMERAKADADLRNETLQREMQLFFQMYGESRRRGGDEIGRGGRGSL
uniref:Rho-GAP domain-containing protein n=1 Tax=Gasterosteus aculeatus aculeatus TaxID=481459 RepID=A0AAQ4R9U1_GASAC|nr:rho GTPase-activating protein 24-like [Gasterosteus aculeatus aculeatus]